MGLRCDTSPHNGCCAVTWTHAEARSEEHTSELQSQSNLVCRLLLEKKKHASYKYARILLVWVSASLEIRPRSVTPAAPTTEPIDSRNGYPSSISLCFFPCPASYEIP